MKNNKNQPLTSFGYRTYAFARIYFKTQCHDYFFSPSLTFYILIFLSDIYHVVPSYIKYIV